jgi:hypothetical protein
VSPKTSVSHIKCARKGRRSTVFSTDLQLHLGVLSTDPHLHLFLRFEGLIWLTNVTAAIKSAAARLPAEKLTALRTAPGQLMSKSGSLHPSPTFASSRPGEFHCSRRFHQVIETWKLRIHQTSQTEIPNVQLKRVHT